MFDRQVCGFRWTWTRWLFCVLMICLQESAEKSLHGSFFLCLHADWGGKKSSLGVPCYIKVIPHDVMETSVCGGCGTWQVARRQLKILDGLDCVCRVVTTQQKLVCWRTAGCLRGVLPHTHSINLSISTLKTLERLYFFVPFCEIN